MYVRSAACVSAFGLDIDAYWQGLVRGVSTLRFGTGMMAQTIVGEVTGVRDEPTMMRSESLALAACELLRESLDDASTGVVIGTNGGRVGECDDGREATRIAQRLGVDGPTLAVRSDCASGIAALTVAAGWLDLEACNNVLLVGTSSFVERRTWELLALAGALGAGGGSLPEPFGHARQGTAAAEGAAALLLTRQPACPATARILGTGLTLNAHRLIAPALDGTSMAAAIRNALHASQLGLEDISAVIAHGTGTPLNDRAEAQALRRVFGGQLHGIPITSVKRFLGHTFASSGVFSVIAAIEALRCGVLPGCGASMPAEEFADLDVAYTSTALPHARSILVLAHGMGVINGAAVVAAPR